MSTYTQILYQIVFSTKNRDKSLTESEQDKLYQYISGILKKNKCHLYRIGGVEDHIHIVTHLHPTVALSRLVKDIKLATSDFIKKEGIFQHFHGWQEGYGAFTYSIEAKEKLIEYVKNQKNHHVRNSYKKEYTQLLKSHNVDFQEKYLF